MRLKRLELQGYKTFASKQEFLFDSGVTAIVGPNGSGKSNIADALRWVLGEQSYSSLRGKRTTDMIFAGSQSRARAGMAQALLTLDNSGGWLPIDFAEVEIGRRAYRSGENEYLLNGQKVRLRDVTDLLATSGLAERNYTIIGQGLIDRALSLRAEERRALFEEAAGINHYKTRRAEALRRLEETQRNLERVHDILSEIRPRLNSLRRQAGRAQNYEQIEADLRHLLRLWYGYQWNRSKLLLKQRRQAAAAAETGWREARRLLQAAEEALETEKHRINEWQSQERQIQRDRDNQRAEFESARRQAAILRERRKLIDDQLQDLAAQLPPAIGRLAATRDELASASTDLQAVQETLSQQQSDMRGFAASFSEQQDQIRSWQKAVRETDQAHRSAQNQLAQLQGQLTQLEERLGDTPDSDAATAEELSRLADALRAGEALVAQRKQEHESARAERQAAAAARQRDAANLKEARQAARQAALVVATTQQDLARLEARRDMLGSMRQKVFEVAGDIPLVGQLSGLLTIPEEYGRALEAALGQRLGALVVSDQQTLWKLISGQQHAVSALSLADVPSAPGRPDVATDGIVGWADQLVTAPEYLHQAVTWLLGTVLCVSDDRTAYSLATLLPPGYSAVTPSGLVVQAGGLVEVKPADSAAGILSREAEWRAASEAFEQAQATQTRAQANAALAAERVEGLQAELEKLEEEERRLGRLEQSASSRQAQAEKELDRLLQQQRFVKRRADETVQTKAQWRLRCESLAGAILAQGKRVEELASTLAESRRALAALPVAELEQERLNWQQKIEATRTILSGRQAVVDSRRATLEQMADQVTRLEKRQTSLQLELESLDIAAAEETLTAHQDNLIRLDRQLTPIQLKLRESEDRVGQLDAQSSARRREAHDVETAYTQTRIDLSQQENAVSGLMDRIHNDLGLVSLPYDDDEVSQSPLPITEVVEQLPVVDELPPDIEDEIQKYRAQLRRIGPINPDAPAEFESTQERHDFLTQQVEDLHETEKQLRGVIAELDELTSKAFAETVSRVDEVFGGMFRRLFGGGSAKLLLTDPDDLTISGVDILARLPSRREQGLGLLSGGERSLTATALIFALLKVAPTPFCVLDEVDAMLDEANINRFVGVLDELSDNTQFIIITHNRGTVQAADTVYGISMGPDSASRVISIRPEEYLRETKKGLTERRPAP